MKKRSLVLFLILMIMATIGSASAYATTDISSASVPTDVEGTVYEEAVKVLVEKDIITGDTDGMFRPNSNLTRAQACIIVVKTINPPISEVTGTATQQTGKSGFPDMIGYGWAEGYIKYAVEHGVIKGYADGTFKPGRIVTTNELITMVLRAADYSDENLIGTWPSNYSTKATELGLLVNIPDSIPLYATKGMAAQINYNALSEIEAANPPQETPGQGTDLDKPSILPDFASMAYANGSFNSTMTTYDGKTISSDIKVYIFGEAKSYSSKMTFTKKLSDYRMDTVFKYKNVKTSAFYKLENGKIVAMIIPMDVGFSGRAYGVINGKLSTLNWEDETVIGLESLTATREITWLGNKNLATTLSGISSSEYLSGEIYEMNLLDGEIQSIYTSSDPAKKGYVFEEISSTGAIFVNVESFNNGVVKVISAHGGAVFGVKDNASVYVLSKDEPTKYTASRLSIIKSGVQIRAYDISDDDDRSADIVIVYK